MSSWNNAKMPVSSCLLGTEKTEFLLSPVINLFHEYDRCKLYWLIAISSMIFTFYMSNTGSFQTGANKVDLEWPSRYFSTVLKLRCGMYGGEFEPWSSTNTCRHVCKDVDRKGSAAMLTPIQSAGVTSEVNLRITQARKHASWSALAYETHGLDVTRSPK